MTKLNLLDNMNKKILKVALAAAVAFCMPTASNAQLGDLIKGAASTAVSKATGNSETGSTIANVVTSLIGTSKVSESNIIGTWNYESPCIAAESSNVLSKATAAAAASKAQTKLNDALTKAGIKPGAMKITFEKGGKATVAVGKKTVAATYKIEGSDLSLTFTKLKKTVKMNCKLSGGKLQLAMKTDKLLTFVNTVSSSAAAASSSLGTLNSLLKNVEGLYVGLQFSK